MWVSKIDLFMAPEYQSQAHALQESSLNQMHTL